MNSLSKFSLLAVTLLTLSLSSCEKEKQTIIKEVYKLPEISLEGKNTGGMLYNGKLLMFDIKPSNTQYEFSDVLRFQISFRENPSSPEIDTLITSKFEINDFKGVGVYRSADIYMILYHYYAKSRFDEYAISKTTDYFDGYVNILRADSVNKIVSGIFEYEYVSTNPMINNGDTVRVTKGRFDLKF